jgi:hypothetical protein
MKWASQVIEIGFKQDLQYVDGKGPRNTFLNFDIAAFPQWGQVSAMVMDLSDLGTAYGMLLMRPNAGIKPTCVVQATAWQAFSATPLPERSGFGLNELLGRSARFATPKPG